MTTAGSTAKGCILCHGDVFVNPLLRMLTSDCGHQYCEDCINKIFMSQQTYKCHSCGTTLRRMKFSEQRVYKDRSLEKENRIRTTVLKEFNKQPRDFATLREYNDYLEEVEDIIYNLLNDIDVPAMEEKLKKNRKDNADVIIRNQNTRTKELEAVKAAIAAQQRETAAKREAYLRGEAERLVEMQAQREERLHSASQQGPKKPVRRPKKAPSPPPAPASSTSAPPSQPATPAPAISKGYIPSLSRPSAPSAPPSQQLATFGRERTQLEVQKFAHLTAGERARTAKRAGGFRIAHARKRSLQEAFAFLVV